MFERKIVIKVELQNIWSSVDTDTRGTGWLQGILTYQAWGKGGQLQTYDLFDRWKNRFPTGMMAHVYRRAKKDGIHLEITDGRQAPLSRDRLADLGWLRDYQLEAIDAVENYKRGLIWCPTGSGKTEIAVGLTQAFPCRWLLVAHRGELVDNAAERYEKRTGAQAGRVGAGQWSAGDGSFICATFQTLHKALKKRDPNALALLKGAEGIIVDESHTLAAWSFQKVAQACTNAYYRVGLSGTPLQRTDHRSMMTVAQLGRVIYRIKTDELIDAGVISKPRIEMRKLHQESEMKTWAAVYRNLVVKSAARNDAIAEMARNAPKPCLVFVSHLEHGRRLGAVLGCKFVDGQAPPGVRREAIRRLNNGDEELLVATNIFNEGVDIPELRSVVIAAGGASPIQALQRIGRGMRKTDSKDRFHVFDVKDTGQRWMEKHAQARVRAYRSEGHTVHIQ